MKILKQSILFLLLFSLILGCETTTQKAKDITEFIPENSTLVLKIVDVQTLKSDLNNNGFVSLLKKTKPYTFFSKKNIFKHLNPASKSIICLTENTGKSHFTFITKQTKNIFNTDSIPNKIIENITNNNKKFQKITIDEQTVFSTIKDSVLIVSSSQQIVEQLLEGKTEKNPIFNKIISLKNTQDVTAIVPANTISIDKSLVFNFASWASIDVKILPDALTATGVVLANDTVPQLISVFKGLQPQHIDIAKVTPTEAKGIVSFTFNDFEVFQNNLQHFRGVKSTNEKETILFDAITEVSKITLKKGNAIVLKSIDPELTNEALQNFITEKDSFKNIEIYDFNKPELFENQFLTLVNKTHPTLVFKLDDFFIFTENETITQQIINSFLSNNVLSKTNYYKESLSQLSDESSLMVMKLNGNYSSSISSLLQTDIGAVSFKKYPLAILQFSYDRNFSHLSFVCKEVTSKKQNTGKVSQLKSIKLEKEALNNPQFFSNHRTGGKDIVVQDIANKLYFISASGKELWTKKLESPILGEIKEVDLLRNGKKQLAFVTQNRFYILDRTGREVAPFSLKFKDEITQPLAVFDYDKNRKYRFIITQGKEVLMLDSKGKTVKGFKFKKTKSTIVFAPQHFRISGKDYIVIAEENGKLNILSRVGKPRITISKTFSFSSTPPTVEGKKIVIISKNNTKNSIGVDGKVSVKKLNVSSYHFTVKGRTKVTLDDNLMRINGVLVELPFGIYTAPKIHFYKKNVYISVTETQENKVYLFTKSGKLLSGLPVFGTSAIDLEDANKNGRINFVTKGGSKEIILYEI